MQPLLLLFSVFLLIGGHDEPGGGFVGGLVAATAFVLQAFAEDVASARRALRVRTTLLIGLGLLVSLSSALLPVLVGEPLLTGLWLELPVPGTAGVHLGTPLLFDLGVFLTVFGVTLTIVFSKVREE